GQKDVEQRGGRVRQAERGEEVVRARDEEVAVLEEAEEAEVGHHADDEEPLAPLGPAVEAGQRGAVERDDAGGGERNGEVDEPMRVRAPGDAEHEGGAEAADEVDHGRYQDQK